MKIFSVQISDKFSEEFDEVTFLWSDNHQSDRVISIPQYIDANATRLRSLYLKFIFDLGNSKILKKRFSDYLKMGDGFNLWHASALVEKSPHKTPEIIDCIKLIALDELIVSHELKNVFSNIKNKSINKSIKHICKLRGVQFRERINYKPDLPGFIGSCVSHVIQALGYLCRYLYQRTVLTSTKKRSFIADNSVLIMAYLAHLDERKYADGVYYSYEWSPLIEKIKSKNISINISHIFVSTPIIKTPKDALSVLNEDNKSSACKTVHSFLDSYISAFGVIRIIGRWILCMRINVQLLLVGKLFVVQGTGVNLWPVLKNCYKSSIYGKICMRNLLSHELLNTFLRSIPRQNLGFYLCENQGWEMAFLHAWRKHGHGKVVGVCPTTIPFWHLYNFSHSLSYEQDDLYTRPMPDFLALNSEDAFREMKSVGYPENKIYRVEALRYLDLKDSTEMNSVRNLQKILILGEYPGQSMAKMMGIMKDVVLKYQSIYNFSIKFHPACNVEIPDEIRNAISVIGNPISDIISNFDVVISGNGTSAALDALVLGVPTFIYHDPSQLNLSPLFGFGDAVFFSNKEELEFLLSSNDFSSRMNLYKNYFYTGKELCRWDALISMLG